MIRMTTVSTITRETMGHLLQPKTLLAANLVIGDTLPRMEELTAVSSYGSSEILVL